MTDSWTRAHVALIDFEANQTQVLTPEQLVPVVPDLYLWDSWPIRHRDGEIVDFGGVQYWMALSAPRHLEPSDRHDLARIRLVAYDGAAWRDLGDVFPEGASRGSREWAGSAILDEQTGRVQLRYTASGRRGEPDPTFVQRIFESTARFDPTAATFGEWSDHDELVQQDRGLYRSTLDQTSGAAGYIKAFRDPSVFVDTPDGFEYLLFTASLAESDTDFDAAVGVATRVAGSDDWLLQEPLLEADGVNNEMERPHVVEHDGSVYLFFSTQARTFHPDVSGPTGLYGFVAETMQSAWTPLNGSGLVLRNPIAEPYQCYSWLVLNDLRVTSFVDMHSLGGRLPDDVEAAGEMREHFAGTPSPFHQIEVEGDSARLVSD